MESNFHDRLLLVLVIPAKAGIQRLSLLALVKTRPKQRRWIPAFAGMTSKKPSWGPAKSAMSRDWLPLRPTLDSGSRCGTIDPITH